MKAGDRGRTGNIQLGRLTLYQLSYTRVARTLAAETLKIHQFTVHVPRVPPVPRKWPMWPMDLFLPCWVRNHECSLQASWHLLRDPVARLGWIFRSTCPVDDRGRGEKRAWVRDGVGTPRAPTHGGLGIRPDHQGNDPQAGVVPDWGSLGFEWDQAAASSVARASGIVRAGDLGLLFAARGPCD